MTVLDGLALGLQYLLTIENLAWCLIGVTAGTMIGVIPGIGVNLALSLLLPLTYKLDPFGALMLMAGICYGCQYGGAITSIFLNVPGNISTAVTCIDGHPMARRGRGGVAVMISAISSFIGSIIGILALIFISPKLSEISLMIGPAEFFVLILCTLFVIGSVNHQKSTQNISLILIGIFLGIIGIDAYSGDPRINVGISALNDGISIVILAMGLFGLAEIFYSFNSSDGSRNFLPPQQWLPSLSEIKQSIAPCLRGSFIGGLVGIIPGIGPATASFASYQYERKISRTPNEFGQGKIEGIAAPESANNAATQTAFIPTISLGIPGDSMMILVMSAMLLQGIVPGPALINDQPEIFWGLAVSFFVGNLFLLILNIPFIKIWTTILKIPASALYPAIIVLMCVGAYSLNYEIWNVMLLLIFGLLGFFLKMLGADPVPIIIGFMLGPILEQNLIKSLRISQGSFDIFFSTTSIVIGLISIMLLMALQFIQNRKQGNQHE